MKNIKALLPLFFVFVFSKVHAQQAPVIRLSPPNYAQIKFEKSGVNLGKIEEGNSLDTSFRFINNGKVPLKISGVNASCDCTISSFPETLIAPGDTSEIRITFHAKKQPGRFVQTLSVVYNSDQSPELLSLEGEVVTAGKE